MFNKKGVFPLGLSLLFVLTTGWSSQCKASPKEDGTTSTQVQTENQSYRIVGGTQAGANLLHSFSQFSVETGWSAIFELPEGTDIANVISRVTGANVSNIDGTLKINNSVSVVNLFLINPNGIVFGKNAQLDLRGSFIASTAQSLKFSDGYILSAKDAVPIAPDLVIGVPIGLQFGVNPGSINGNFTEPGSGLRVESGQTLALIGGPLRLSGASEAQQNISSGFNKASPAELRADEGQIILGSVGDNEFVKLSTPSSALNGSIDFTEVHQFQDIQLQNGLRIGGRDFKKIDLQGRQIFLNQGVRLGEPAYLDTQNQGMISISAAERLQLLDSFIFSQTIGPAKGGDILIQSPQVILDNNSVISVSSDNPYDFSDLGSAGNITILSDQISLNHESGIQANSATIAPAGNIQISTKDLNLNQGASITSDSQSGQGGNLNLTVQNALILRNGSNISTSSTTTGNGGNIRINAGIIGAIPTEDSNINTTAESGNGGAINISTQGLLGIYPNLNGNAPNSSDITAKSQSGVDGIVNTNIFTTNTVVSFTQPPIQLNQKLVKVSCFSNQQGKGDRFVNSGQGGLPTHPSQIADQAMVWQDLRPIHASQSGTQQVLLESRVDSTRSNLPTPLVEAQGWIFETDGSVNLVSEPTVAEPSNLQADRQPCLVPTS